jgi:hypothetical protein
MSADTGGAQAIAWQIMATAPKYGQIFLLQTNFLQVL